MIKFGGLFFALCVLTACSGIQYKVPEADSAEQQAALAEIEASSSPGAVSAMSEGVAQDHLRDVYGKIKPSATEVCRFAGESSVCAWVVSYSNAREYNAVAMDGNRVVVFHEIIAATDSDDELAFVLAHELGHHIADHITETRRHRNMGIFAAGIAMASLSHGTGGCTTLACQNALQNAAGASMQLGGEFGSLIFSEKQEKEADYLAAYILNLAGYDLEKSRTMLVKIGTKVDGQKASFLNSHPAGPERLASYDKTIEIILTDSDGFPGTEPLDDEKAQVSDNNQEVKESDSRKCRIYLPDQNICIY